MHPILIDLGKFKVYSWGFMLAIAVILAIWGISRMFARERYRSEAVLDMVIIMVLAGLLGSRIAYIILYEWQEFLADPGMVLSLSGGFRGLVWYGALVAGFIAFLIYIWIKNMPFWKIADIFAPFIALGYAIVRIGCFLNGCCYGKVTHSALGVVFPYVDNLTRHPTQLYSSGLNLLLFLYLIWLYPRRKFSGQVFIMYLMGYSVYRFIVEFFRETEVMYGMFTMGQVYTAILFVLALVLYLWRRSKRDRSLYIF